MENRPSLHLVDNTSPTRLLSDDEALSEITTADDLSRNTSRRWTKPSVRRELTKRKYKKWQPHNLGITDDDTDRQPSNARLSLTATYTSNTEGESLIDASFLPTTEQRDFNVSEQDNSGQASVTSHGVSGLEPGSELEILYENQRGWFFFGIPLYSHGSLLNLDPAAWVTHNLRNSPVNITNAQVPDPSWEWAWKTWYVDMSGDVDDQGWQYSFSFSSSAWHGSHPWFHSFVRRRRWVRLRVKKSSERSRRGRSGFEAAHMLNEDYFTIHTAKRKRAASMGRASQGPSTHLSRAPTTVDEAVPLEEIGNIPTLMYALKDAKVDREKLDILRRFVEEGGQELYYLDGKIQEIMTMFVFQASRWQLVTYLTGVIDELSEELSEATGVDAEEVRRQKDYLTKAVNTAKHHLTGPEILASGSRVPAPEMSEMLDLTPAAKRESLLSRSSGRFSQKPIDNVRHRRSTSSIQYTPTCTAKLRNASGFVAGLSFGESTRRWATSNTAVKPGVTEGAGSSERREGPITMRENGQAEQTQGGSEGHGIDLPGNTPDTKPSLPPSPKQAKSLAERRERLFNIFADIELKPNPPRPPSAIPKSNNGPKGRDLKTHMRPLATGLKSPSHESPRTAMKTLSVRDRRKLRSRLFLKRTTSEEKTSWTLWTKLEELFERLEQNTTVWKKRGETVALLAGATDMAMRENVWYVPVHNGDGQYRKVVLSDRITNAKDLQEKVFPSMEAMERKGIPVPLIRDSATLDMLLPLSQNLSITRSVPVYGAPKGKAHQKQVAKHLISLFWNDRYHGFLSTAALNTALSFLLSQEAEHVVTVDSFNTLLKFAAQKQDPRLFRQFLLTMPRLDIRPDQYTWLTFLDCLICPKAKASLVSRMIQKGYLNGYTATRTAVQLTIQNTFLAHLESGKSVDSFMNMLIDTHGANWFPPSLINQMLSVITRRKDQGFALKSSTVTQIALMFRKDIFSALQYLFRFIDHPEKKLEKDAWEKLFLTAFKGRHYNICRGVTYKMRQSTGHQYNDLWLNNAGKVIVGLDLHIPHYPFSERFAKFVPPEFDRNPVASLATFKPAGEEREKQQRLASALTLRDMEVGPMYRPSRSMGIMLEAAAVLDQEWKWVPRPTQWLMQNAIQVPVERRSNYVQ
ncbi:hypothetical protein BDV28DRAFT_157477 [Aspergillus coremiiformis]|uniref:Peroxin/Ferlin domain-containing protein n=1 Tax=Aspergillus coremiiformis TaxID=138285 RepID=A0A5N6Z5C0_9EURO|nr:hypothetical protein BDV28DRAFT_157477 [Aspergillus coremiiformis]